MRKLENEGASRTGGEKLENLEMRKWDGGDKLALTEELLVYSTLAKFKTLPKFEMKKRRVETVRSIRKETEKNGRGEEEFLMKKGCKMGGVSL